MGVLSIGHAVRHVDGMAWSTERGREGAARRGPEILNRGALEGAVLQAPQRQALQGLGREIRIRGDVEWRLIGHREQSSDTFTVVMICNHKGTVYQPHDALLTAVRKWKEMENGLEGDKLDVHPI